MSWSKEQIDYGVLKLDGKNKVRVYKNTSQYETIQCSDEIKDYRWGGDGVVITFTNGKVRRYKSTSQYDNV